jgi:acyl dehydratase
MKMGTVLETIDDLRGLVGTDLGLSEWILIDQERINLFAEVTGDAQWIHVDRERAKSGPFGTTVAHGYLTLSLLTPMWSDILDVKNAGAKINYGLDKVRFVSPVPVDSRIRTRASMTSIEDVDGGVQVRVLAVIERDGSDKPVCVAEPIFRFYS